MKNIIDHGIESWKAYFKTKVILLYLFIGVIIVCLFWCQLKSQYNTEITAEKQVLKASFQNYCDSVQYSVDTAYNVSKRVLTNINKK